MAEGLARRAGGPPAGGVSGPGDGWPAGWGVELSARTRRPSARTLIGGSPLRIVRLTEAGGRLLDGLLGGGTAGTSPAAGRLARLLTGSGLASPAIPQPAPAEGRLSVVIPVRDRPEGLAATLAHLGDLPEGAEVIVVDDASADPGATERVVAASPLPPGAARVVRRAAQGGPAAARNTGWRAAGGSAVAFVDADCTPARGWLELLGAHLADGTLGAVAPRIRSAPPPAGPARGGVLARYETARSPLDLGPAPAPVRPGSTVPYVPSAAVMIRREALEETGGFDESLPVGEDVDLVWRLAAAGWAVRYEPAAVVGHPPRPTLAAWLRQRFSYGTSAGPLAARHGPALAPVALGWTSAAAWAAPVVLGPAGGVLAGAACTGWTVWALSRKAGLDVREAARVAVAGHLSAGRGLAEGMRRPWWPLTVLLAVSGRRGRIAAATALAPLAAEWLGARRPVGPAAWLALRVADDVAYGTGVWWGALRARRLSPLLPRLAFPGTGAAPRISQTDASPADLRRST